MKRTSVNRETHKIRASLLRSNAKTPIWIPKMTKAVAIEVIKVTMPMPDCFETLEFSSLVLSALAACVAKERLSIGPVFEAAMTGEESNQAEPNNIMPTAEKAGRCWCFAMTVGMTPGRGRQANRPLILDSQVWRGDLRAGGLRQTPI